MNEIVLSDEECRTLQEGIAAWLEMQQTDPNALWQQVGRGEGVLYPDPVIDVPARRKWTGVEKMALLLSGVMVVVFVGASIALLASGGGWWSLFGILDVAIILGAVVWAFGDRLKRKGGAA